MHRLLDKDTIIKEMNEHLRMTTVGPVQISTHVHEAPVIHALVEIVCEHVNYALVELEERACP